MSADAPKLAETGDDELSRANYEFMMDRDVPGFVDRICQHILTEKPVDMHRSVAEFLRGAAAGNFRGGVIVAGENVGGGWIRYVDTNGVVRAEVDRLAFNPESGMQLLACSPRDGSILVAINQPGSEVGTVRKYSMRGVHTSTLEFPKHVSAITVDRNQGTLFIGLKGGGLWVVQHNGSKLREFATPTPLAIRVTGETLWVLTQKAIERRNCSNGQLDGAIHLPESMTAPCSFAVGTKYVWVASPNPDGSANFVGAYDFSGRPMPLYVPTPGCLIRRDAARGGIWQLSRQANGMLAFHNEKGSKVVSCDVGKGKVFNVAPDESSDYVWVLKVDFSDDNKLLQYDVMRGAAVREISLPGTSSVTTHLLAA